jgi:hypothetical protein
MNWGMMAAVLDHMRDRLEAGGGAGLLGEHGAGGRARGSAGDGPGYICQELDGAFAEG